MKTEVMKHEQFGEVRTVVIDAVKWFAARDVAIALGYKKPNNFLNKHLGQEEKRAVMLPSLPLSPSSVMRNTVVVNDKGVVALCDAAFCDFAEDIKHWLLSSVGNNADKPALFDKIGYIDDKGTAWFNAEFVAHGLGFVHVEEKVSPTNGRKLFDFFGGQSYTSVRWERINAYLAEFGYAPLPVGKDDFLPENIVYRLAMKANNDAAVNFQMKIANEILPSIRKYGYYSVKEQVEEPAKKTLKPLVPVAVVYAVLFANMLVKIGITSDFYRRLKELRKETHQDIIAFVTTPFLTLDDARLLELTLKAKFFDRLVKGEFFNVDFEIVKAALVAPDDKFNKLLSLANLLPDSDEKTRLVLQAASLV